MQRSQYTNERKLGKSVYQESRSDKLVYHGPVLQNHIENTVANTISLIYRVSMCPVKLRKPRNLIVAFSRTGKGLLAGPGKVWKSFKLELKKKKKMKCTADSKEMNNLKILGVKG